MIVRPRATPRQPAARLPSVTVVVPCYNYGHYLPECVNSIVTQPGVDTNVLIIDDASTDGSHEVAQVLASRHQQVRTIRHERNHGHIATYNEGLAMVDSDYVVLLSADDALTPGALGRATALMEAHPSVGLVYGRPIDFFDELPTAATRVKSWSIWPGERWIGAQFRRSMSIIYSPEAVVRTSVHHQVGYYRPELPHSGDLEMWLRVASIAGVGRVNGADQAFRRIHPASMMRTKYGTVLKDLVARNEAYESFLATAGKDLPNIERLRATARRSMCQEALDWVCSVLAAQHAGQPSDGAVVREVAESVAFAQHVYPQYATLLAWGEYRRRNRHHGLDGVDGKLASAFHGIRRDVRGRIRWQRWYRFGT